MKKFAIVTAVLTITLVGCSASTVAEAKIVETVSTATDYQPVEQSLWNDSLIEEDRERQRQLEAAQKVIDDTERVNATSDKLRKYIGKTWYVFGGATPQGWDCSGLVVWYYKQLGIELYHSASAQKYEGKPRKYSEAKAKVGDIIWNPGHVGIYDGDGYMIHSPNRGLRTERVKVWEWANDNGTSNVTYTRLIKTN
jgi:cell wall-associated NlpC family hydrolase